MKGTRHIKQDDRLAQRWMRRFERALSAEAAQEPKLPALAVANPPYQTVETRREDYHQYYALSYRWKKGTPDDDQQAAIANRCGNFYPTPKLGAKTSLSALFTEICFRQLEVGEVAVMLVDNGLLSTSGWQYARVWMLNEAELVASIQMPQTSWAESGSSGPVTSFLVWRRSPDNLGRNYDIFMGLAETCGCDSRGRRIYKRNKQTGESIEFAIDDDLIELMSEYRSFVYETALEANLDRPIVNGRNGHRSKNEQQTEQPDTAQAS